MQQSLFPVRVRALIPNALNTADLQYFAYCDDGHEYAVKQSSRGNASLPAAEYLSYCLASMCQVAVPQSAQLLMPDNSLAFGSRFEGGITEYPALSATLQPVALQQCGAQLTALLTLDVFLANDDRHGGNFLLRQARLTQQWSMIAIDFSRALWANGFPHKDVKDIVSAGNSSTTIRVLKAMKLWDQVRSHTTISVLNSVTVGAYSNWVNAMPASWQTPEVVQSVQWWGSPDRPTRISSTMECLK